MIKIDVEGFELEVLAGLKKTLEREKPPVIFEYDARVNGVKVLQDYFPDDYRIDVIDAKGRLKPLDGAPKFYGALLAQSRSKS